MLIPTGENGLCLKWWTKAVNAYLQGLQVSLFGKFDNLPEQGFGFFLEQGLSQYGGFMFGPWWFAAGFPLLPGSNGLPRCFPGIYSHG